MIPSLNYGQLGRRNSGRDPYWARVVLLADMRGSDTSTTFIDRTGRHTIAASGNAQVDTGDSDFPDGALLLDGTSDYLTVSGTLADFAFGTDDVTIECYAKHSAFADAENFICGNYAGTGSGGFAFYVNAASGAGTEIAIRQRDSVIETRSIALSTSTMRHYAFVRRAGTCRLFVDGAKVGSDISTLSGTLGDASAIGIGSGAPTYPDSFEVTGWVQWLRITKDSRYWGDFTAPLRPLQSI